MATAAINGMSRPGVSLIYTNLLIIVQPGLASGASIDLRLSPNGVSERDLLAPA